MHDELTDKPKNEIVALTQWLEPRLDALLAHVERVRTVLGAVGAHGTIIESAAEVVLRAPPGESNLSPQQIAVWRALLPLVAEHALLALKNESLPFGAGLTKTQAAAYLGISVRKLQRHMRKRQVQYEKLGAGKTAAVKFHREQLDKFREARSVATRSTTAKSTT